MEIAFPENRERLLINECPFENLCEVNMFEVNCLDFVRNHHPCVHETRFPICESIVGNLLYDRLNKKGVITPLCPPEMGERVLQLAYRRVWYNRQVSYILKVLENPKKGEMVWLIRCGRSCRRTPRRRVYKQKGGKGHRWKSYRPSAEHEFWRKTCCPQVIEATRDTLLKSRESKLSSSHIDWRDKE